MKNYGQVKGRAYRNEQPIAPGRRKKCSSCGTLQRIEEFIERGNEYKACINCRLKSRSRTKRYREDNYDSKSLS